MERLKRLKRKTGVMTAMALLLMSMALVANRSVGKPSIAVDVGAKTVHWWSAFRHDLRHA